MKLFIFIFSNWHGTLLCCCFLMTILNCLQLKERTQKLESWRAKENLREEKEAEKKELLRRQSSVWIKDENFERRMLEAIVDTTPL